ncbi:RHO1 GDP-GTP exchange protein 2, partial [Nowakowskiella sp. JEL0078]
MAPGQAPAIVNNESSMSRRKPGHPLPTLSTLARHDLHLVLDSVSPALLSRLALAFRVSVPVMSQSLYLAPASPDSLDSELNLNCFSGKDALDTLEHLLKIYQDRMVAMVLAKSLLAQNFFCHIDGFAKLPESSSLRDSPSEFYAFIDDFKFACSNSELDIPSVAPELPVGVFTLLTDCYSPTCSKYQRCYSFSCPRRFEQ